MTPPLEVVARSIESLIPYARNARTHSPQQIKDIEASLVEFGWCNAVLTDGRNGILAGHGRVQAATNLMNNPAAVIPNWPDKTTVPTIDLSHLSKAQQRAYVLQDNKSALNAGWDFDMLAVELAELRDMGFDTDLTAFGQDEVDAILGGDAVKSLDELGEEYGEHDEQGFWPKIALQVPGEVKDRYDSLMRAAPDGHDWQRLDALLACVDTSALRSYVHPEPEQAAHVED